VLAAEMGEICSASPEADLVNGDKFCELDVTCGGGGRIVGTS